MCSSDLKGFLVDGAAGVETALGAFEDQGGVGLGLVADAYFEGGLGGSDAGPLQQGVAAALGGEFPDALQLGDLGIVAGGAVAGFGLSAPEGRILTEQQGADPRRTDNFLAIHDAMHVLHGIGVQLATGGQAGFATGIETAP